MKEISKALDDPMVVLHYDIKRLKNGLNKVGSFVKEDSKERSLFSPRCDDQMKWIKNSVLNIICFKRLFKTLIFT